MTPFHKILIANRGEIAHRVIRTAKAMGYRTVAVYSDADEGAAHVNAADEAVHIGASPVGESYLVAEKLIAAAQQSGSDAIHPGYGFLSENSDFAHACEQADIRFIGPNADAIALMGNKRLSKVAMLEAGVPCIPGYQAKDQTDERLISEAMAIGFPIMVKASAGGGGRGMRLVTQAEALEAALKTARSEAQSAFGNGELILERAVLNPRHIEIQVFADHYGNTVYLGERDCSIQRRHQKVVEEAPSPFVDESLRQRMGAAAVLAAQSCHYRGAGTVEFLVDAEQNFYFLEMNTRLQVEHPVTELITGQDLVAWQLKVAAGEKLPLRQAEIQLQGHAMEVRIYAEDPRHQFMPQTGVVQRWQAPTGDGVRVDHGIVEGQVISPHYDPMLAKVIAWGENREVSRRRLACATEDMLLLGINNNQRFLANILRHPVFINGDATTAFLETHFNNDPSILNTPPSLKCLLQAAMILHAHSGRERSHQPTTASWQNSQTSPCRYLLRQGSEIHAIAVHTEWRNNILHYHADDEGENITLALHHFDQQQCIYSEQGLRQRLPYVLDGHHLFIAGELGNLGFEDITHSPALNTEQAGNGLITAPMDGAIVDILVKQGEAVERGQTIVVLEAMKMEHALKSDLSGIVTSMKCSVGDQVKGRQLLTTIAAHEEDV